MSRLGHKCPFCPFTSVRHNVKRHITKEGKNGPYCPGLKRPLSPKEWQEGILPFYTMDCPLPDVTVYTKKKRGRKRKREMVDLPTRSRTKRLSADGLISDDGTISKGYDAI